MKPIILLVDDEIEISQLLKIYLENEGFETCISKTPEEALKTLDTVSVSLAVIDILMPGMDGFEMLRRIRQKYRFPVLFLSARSEEIDKINGLLLGADDYITKPFQPLEVVARIKAQLRRASQYNQPQRDTLFCRGLVLERRSHRCFLNEKLLNLTPREFSILEFLLLHSGEVIQAEKLFEAIWKEDYYSAGSNTIMVHIRHIRQKMKDNPEKPKYIKTVWGVGYVIEK